MPEFPQRLGLFPLGRPTFDLEFAGAKLRGMLKALEDCGAELTGPRDLLTDDESVDAALDQLALSSIDGLAVLQATFTDAAAVVTAAEKLDVPVMIWAVREPRAGQRLRLNALCGLNLASHALGLRQIGFNWLYADPEDAPPGQLRRLLTGPPAGSAPVKTPVAADADQQGAEIAAKLRGSRIGRIGEHPPGFDTCAFDRDQLERRFGISVSQITLEALFSRSLFCAGNAAADDEIPEVSLKRTELFADTELNRSLCLKPALRQIALERNLDAMAVKCWPEAFTEYGGAMCGPVSLLAEQLLPCACESDVYGAVSQLMLQRTANAPVFLTDLVDVDVKDDTAVIWHCGQAPMSMCDPCVRPEATIHSNRKLPLLFQFPLKPGFVTIMRVSKAFGAHKLVLMGGEMMRRPLAYSGTAGVLRFERPARAVLSDIIGCGLEHHFAIAYGDHRTGLRSAAASLNLPVLEI